MTPQLVFTKTAAGRDALTSLPPELGPLLRSVLIVIDGKRWGSLRLAYRA